MAKLVSKTYGEALFELAAEENEMDAMMEEVEAVDQVLRANPEFVQLMSHPKISVEEKSALLEEAFQGKVSDHLTGFFMTLESKGRFREVEEILGYFTDKVREYKKIGTAQVTSAAALTDQQKKEVEKRLLDTTSYQSFRINYKIDPSLIGGIVIQIGDRVVDSSIKTKLANMAKELSKIQLAN